MTSRESRETAWYSWDEWNHVRFLLYNFNDPLSQCKGIEIVNAWKSRLRAGALPISVELTAALVASYSNNIDINFTEEQWRLSMAMCVVRFVNGVTDQLQTGLYAQSVQLIADQVKIPDWMVDLRHEVTHSQLPGLNVLKAAVQEALTWLDGNYWKFTWEKVNEKQKMTFIENIILQYTKLVSSQLEDKYLQNWSGDSEKCKQKKYSNVMNALSKTLHHGHLKFVAKILIQSDYLFPNSRVLDLANIPLTSVDQDWNKIYAEQVSTLVECWVPLFTTLIDLYPSFVEIIASEVVCDAEKNSNKKSCLRTVFGLIILFQLNVRSNIVVNYLLRNPSRLGFSLLQSYMDFDAFNAKKDLRQLIDMLTDVMYCFNSACVSVSISALNHEERSCFEKLKSKFKQLDNLWNEISYSERDSLPPMGEFLNPRDYLRLDLDCKHYKELQTTQAKTPLFNGNSTQSQFITGENLANAVDCLFGPNSEVLFDSRLNNNLQEEETLVNIDFDMDEEDDGSEKSLKENSDNSLQSRNILKLDRNEIVFF